MLLGSFSTLFSARSGADNPASRVIVWTGRPSRAGALQRFGRSRRDSRGGVPTSRFSSRGSVLVFVFVVEGIVDGVFEVVVEHVGHVCFLIVVVVLLVISAHAPDGDYADEDC